MEEAESDHGEGGRPGGSVRGGEGGGRRRRETGRGRATAAGEERG